MLKEILIENFKAFALKQIIQLRPITLLFGINSSGKSSVLQTLLLLKQTVEEAESPETVLLTKGKTVDLGSYKEMIYGHDIDRPLRLGFRLDDINFKNYFSFRKRALKIFSDKEIDDFWIVFEFASERKKNFKLEEIVIGNGEWENPLASFDSTSFKKREFLRRTRPFVYDKGYESFKGNFLKLKEINSKNIFIEKEWNLFNKDIPKNIKNLKLVISRLNSYLKRYGSEALKSNTKSPKRNVSISKKIKEIQQEIETINCLVKKLEEYSFNVFIKDVKKINSKALMDILHFLPIGPVYYKSEKDPSKQFEESLYFLEEPFFPDFTDITILISMHLNKIFNKIIYLGPLREYPERHYIFSGNVLSNVGKSGKFMPDLLFRKRNIVRKVNEWLDRFDIGYILSAKTVKDRDVEDVFTLRLVDKSNNIGVSPLDVGFGISQILPILVQGIVAKERIIIVEQPEIHLHPKLQAQFGDFLVDCISSKNKNQFIIETHSEHLILRLQSLIRKKLLSIYDISVIVLENSNNGTIAHNLRIDENGDFIDEWPGGFFPERLDELL